MKKLLLIATGLLTLIPQVHAHHSFAVHFLGDQFIEVTGVVEKFTFSNPHGVLTFISEDENGNAVKWHAETNSPNMLRRRGWEKESLKPGDNITITGYPARTKANYMRISHINIKGGGELSARAKAD